MKAGVKSTALLFGKHVRVVLTAFAAAFVLCMIYAGVLNDQGWAYFVVSCGGVGAHLSWQLLSWDVDEARDSGAKFVVCPRLSVCDGPPLTMFALHQGKRKHGLYCIHWLSPRSLHHFLISWYKRTTFNMSA